jgi:hypothetical protein
MRIETVLGFLFGILFTLLLVSFTGKETKMYKDGVKDTQKVAFEKGYMEKIIGKDDNVIYVWK